MSDTDKFDQWYQKSNQSGLISGDKGPFPNEFCAFADFNAGQFYFKWTDLDKVLAGLKEFGYDEKLLNLNVKITELGKKTGWIYLHRYSFPDGQSVKLKDVDPEWLLHKELV